MSMGIDGDDSLASVTTIAETLGNAGYRLREDLYGVGAVVTRQDNVHVHLRRSPFDDWRSEKFNFARAIGDAVCFPEGGASVVNRLHGAERQAMGRAFAAEFLAPVDRVSEMFHGGWDTDDIAGQFAVDTRVIQHQIENRDRIAQACS